MPLMPSNAEVEARILFQAGHPSSWPYPMQTDFVRRLVYEGLHVGKTPWSADSFAEDDARAILNSFGNYPQEWIEETCTRRASDQMMMPDQSITTSQR
jgi:hypothetical protein